MADAVAHSTLQHLYESAGGTHWRARGRWLHGNGNVCRWHGIECDGSKEVLSIDIGGNGARGTLPSQLGQLSRLRVLNIDESQLSGTLPTQLAGLTYLTTILLASNHRLSGSIPRLDKLASLTELDVSRTRLSGTLSSLFGSNHALRRLQLDHTALSGTVPSQLGLLRAQSLFLHESRLLSGTLSRNLFTGPLSTSLYHGASVASTRLSGTLPTQLGLAARLRSLWVVHTAVSGTVPSQLGALHLTEMELHANRLSGSLPSQLGSMQGTLRRCVLTTKQGVHQPRHSMRPVDRGVDSNRFACPLPNTLPAPCRPHLECAPDEAGRTTDVEQRGRGRSVGDDAKRGRGGRGRRRGRHVLAGPRGRAAER